MKIYSNVFVSEDNRRYLFETTIIGENQSYESHLTVIDKDTNKEIIMDDVWIENWKPIKLVL